MEETKLKIRHEFTYIDLVKLRNYINQIIEQKVEEGYGLSDEDIISLYKQLNK